MKQFLLYLTKISGYKMRNFLIPILFSMFANFATAQSAGFNNAFAVLSINGGGNTYYDMNGSTENTDFNGTVLGIFSSGNSLLLKGAEHNVYKCGGCDLTSTRLNYRIYITGNTPGSFLNLGIGYFSGFNNGCGGQDQKWANSDFSVDILSGLSAGNYTFEIFSDATITCSTGTAYVNNGGSNYKATFTVAKAESTIAVAGTTSFTYDNTPQGPSAATVIGSTGAVTYSYVGVSPTIYAVNATPPTNPGTYTVMATVASDDNYNGASSSVIPFTIDAGLYTYIPDTNFLQALITAPYNITHLGDCVLTSNISGVTNLNVIGKSIVSLIGIKDFASLTMLQCNDNAITDLDVSGMTQLNYLYCQDNSIANLNISGLTNLWELMISNNPLSTPILDLQGSPDLYFLFCENNGLTGINITGLTNLHDFGMLGNAIETLDLSANTNLNYLDCDDNAFTSINVTGLTNLQYFYCSNNQLESINVSGLSNLIEFYCNDNLLNSLDLKGLTSLDYFDCTANTLPMCILVDDVIAANTATTTEVLPSTDPKSYFWAKDVDADYSYCDCSLPITWNGSAWSNGTGPISTKAAVISGAYNESANISACTLTITSDAIVTIPSGFNVTLNAPLTVETGGVFTLSNNANLIQSTNTANIGNVVVNRNSNSLYRQDYTMWSSPVASQNLLAFSPLTTVTPDSRFYTYNSATDKYSAIVNPSAAVFAKGAGYLIRMPNTAPDYPTASIFSGVFTGVPNTGNVTLAVTNDTYNAIGNPYPSTISADTFITANGITEALYFWRKRNNENQAGAPTTSYATYTLAGGSGTEPSTLGGITPNGTIQVGQGFIAKSTSTTLKFTNTMRTANNSNQIMKTKAIERNRVWVNLTNSAGAFSQMMVAYMSGATQDIDAAIDGRYFNDSQMALNSLINSEEFAIQGRALPFDGTDIVPLAFKTNLAGDYTIAIDHVDGLFSGSQDVFLKDNNTGMETNLKAGAYTFTAAAGVDNARFSLKYQRTLGVNSTVFNDDSVTIHKNKGTLYVNSGAMTINNIKVFDIQGRLIVEQKNVKSNTATIKDLKATQQVLIVKITSQDNKVVSKKVVN
jgi:hypothetical protein